MIDIHNHLIFGVDDGAMDFEETKKMLVMASLDGITDIIATPHYAFEKERHHLVEKHYVEALNWIETTQLPIRLYLGNELLLGSNLEEDLEEGCCKSLAGSKYILVEFYRHMQIISIKRFLFQLCIKGYVPVIAHCERLVENKTDLALLYEMRSMGCMLQVNASKVLAPETRFQRKWIYRLLKENAISFIASDAHGSIIRQPKLKEAYKVIAKKLGESVAQRVFIDNQNEIIHPSHTK